VTSSLCGHYVNQIGRANVVPWAEIVRRCVHREPIEGDEFCPGRFDGETAAHHLTLSP
jgi:hypothetical protein